MIKLDQYQLDALDKTKNGCVLNGGVGSGKSITSISWYYLSLGGSRESLTGGRFEYLPRRKMVPLYIITTARKRDTKEWEKELEPFGLFNTKDHETVIIDSWNNIKKYRDVKDCYFIFDEQRAVGRGAWAKTFIKIAKANKWILLTATPGDNWNDYVPLFIANGFYRNRTEFNDKHVIWNPHVPYQQILKYYNTSQLMKYKRQILIPMRYHSSAESHHEDIMVGYDKMLYRDIVKTRWKIYDDRPIKTAGEYCQILRRIVNSDESRQKAFLELLEASPRAIVFYTYNYERDILIELLRGLKRPYSEWNGFSHDPIPKTPEWVYLVQYTAGCEGWNCIETNTIIFYDESYSYKQMIQAAGRIDRRNTPFGDLYYYHLRSSSSIDNAIRGALIEKKQFNESGFAPRFIEDERRPHER